MRLIACRLQNVRRHRELELEFGRSLTLITGANESGKSTLVEALHKGLFLRATATGRGWRSCARAGMQACRRWRSALKLGLNAGGYANALPAPAAPANSAMPAVWPSAGRKPRNAWRRFWGMRRRWKVGASPSCRSAGPTCGCGRGCRAESLEGSQERYDHQRLIHQLQQQGSSGALESNRDRLVLEQIQQQVATLYTATGRVKAGSPLAEAQRRSQEAAAALSSGHQQVADLEAAMEQWRSINERLHAIDQLQRPALLRELDLEQRTQLLQAQLQPLLQQQQDQRQLQEQQHQEQQEQAQLQTRLSALLQQQQESSKQRDLLKQQVEQLNTTLRQMAQRQETAAGAA